MSATSSGGTNPQAGTAPAPQPGAAGGADPSMEDILASIRRILSEDEAPPAELGQTAHATATLPPDEPDVLSLEESMIVAEPHAAVPPPEPASPTPASPTPAPPAMAAPVPAMPAADPARLVAPEAEAAAAGSVSALLRAVVAGREQVHVYRGGPTIEDLVREEIRPLLKSWLDENLPPLVERLVRTEIERVVGRALP